MPLARSFGLSFAAIGILTGLVLSWMRIYPRWIAGQISQRDLRLQISLSIVSGIALTLTLFFLLREFVNSQRP